MLKAGTGTNEHLNIMSFNLAGRFVLLWGGPLNQHFYKHINVPNFSQLQNFPHLQDILCSLKILSDAFKSRGGSNLNDPNLFLHPSNENNPCSIHLASSGLMKAKIEMCMSTDSKLVHYAKWRLNCDTPSEQETLQVSFFAIGADLLSLRFPFSLSGSRGSKGHHLGRFMLSLHTPGKWLISWEGHLTNLVHCAQISTPTQKCEFLCNQVLQYNFYFLRVKKAEECFKQAREKASYSVKPKHATGIVRSVFISTSAVHTRCWMLKK